MTRRALVLLLALAAPACGGDDRSSAAGFTTRVDHPLVPLDSVPQTFFAGRDGDARTRGSNRLLRRTAVVDGVRVAVLENKEYEDGELVEHTLDYFAQRRDGSVWYFGERVDNYEHGRVNHEGQWLAGKGNARAGLYMPRRPEVGQVFRQERAPGVAEDRSTVLAVGLERKTPAGEFDDCIEVEDFSPIDRLKERKYYCAGVGLVHEDEPHAHSDLVRYRRAKPK